MTIRILMIDDHPLQIEGYKTVLNFNEAGHDIETAAAYSCEAAFEALSNPDNAGKFDLVFLDLSLPSYPQQNIHSGEDLAVLIRKAWPHTKIVLLTSHREMVILYKIIRGSDPEGILVKSDIGGEELLEAFDAIVSGKKYYSATVNTGLKELLSREKYLDSTNLEIILLLYKGVKLKDMPDYLNISKSAIEKRKTIIKEYFFIEKGTDADIVREAKRLGLL